MLSLFQYPRCVPTAEGISYMIASVRDQNTGFDSAQGSNSIQFNSIGVIGYLFLANLGKEQPDVNTFNFLLNWPLPSLSAGRRGGTAGEPRRRVDHADAAQRDRRHPPDERHRAQAQVLRRYVEYVGKPGDNR